MGLAPPKDLRDTLLDHVSCCDSPQEAFRSTANENTSTDPNCFPIAHTNDGNNKPAQELGDGSCDFV
jgi:hypothetical protein